MPEYSGERKIFSLLEVTQSIQRTIAERYKSAFWVKAEMIKLQYYPHSGHCYPELAEKRDGKIISQVRANLWRDDYIRINRNFLGVLREPLKDGITLLFLAKVTFDPLHGMALRIMDADPVFSLGELEREKQDTILKLQEEGIFGKNKGKELPLLPQRIAIISVQTSKGYADFMKMIETNPWGYKFFNVLFPSVLQGEKAIPSIMYQLKRIRKVRHHFDVVAIVRGGGGDLGLSCFNDFQLSREIANFPIPVITGIGHATNETVAEMVSFKNAITPTELAGYLLQKFHDFAMPVMRAREKIIERVRKLQIDERSRFNNTAKYFRTAARSVLNNGKRETEESIRTVGRYAVSMLRKENETCAIVFGEIPRKAAIFCSANSRTLEGLKEQVFQKSWHKIKEQNSSVENLRRIVKNMDPQNVLKRGYSITLLNGKVVKSIDAVKDGDIVNTVLPDGTVTSEVRSIGKTE